MNAARGSLAEVEVGKLAAESDQPAGQGLRSENGRRSQQGERRIEDAGAEQERHDTDRSESERQSAARQAVEVGRRVFDPAYMQAMIASPDGCDWGIQSVDATPNTIGGGIGVRWPR